MTVVNRLANEYHLKTLSAIDT